MAITRVSGKLSSLFPPFAVITKDKRCIRVVPSHSTGTVRGWNLPVTGLYLLNLNSTINFFFFFITRKGNNHLSVETFTAWNKTS